MSKQHYSCVRKWTEGFISISDCTITNFRSPPICKNLEGIYSLLSGRRQWQFGMAKQASNNPTWAWFLRAVVRALHAHANHACPTKENPSGSYCGSRLMANQLTLECSDVGPHLWPLGPSSDVNKISNIWCEHCFILLEYVYHLFFNQSIEQKCHLGT